MTEQRGFFTDAWRACLLAHFEHVVREGDWKNEASLRKVLNMVGVGNAQLDEMIVAIAPDHHPATPEIVAEAPVDAPISSADSDGGRLPEVPEIPEGVAVVAPELEPDPVLAEPPTPEPEPTIYAQVDLFAALGGEPATAGEPPPPPPPPKGKKPASKPKQMGFFDG